MSRPFRFKQFTIEQKHAPMKVGTDGVLIGAWAGTASPRDILDIGTGTGLISLMLAQRFPRAKITAIEPNADAILDASFNFKNSPFAERLNLLHSALDDYVTDQRFDLIVSNPPFFSNSLLAVTSGRSEARHTDWLSPADLAKASKLLAKNGAMAVIYPPETYATFASAMKQHGFSEYRRTEVRPTPEKPCRRILGEFAREENRLEISEIIIEKYGRHRYSEEYVALTKEFYLFSDKES